MRATFLIPTISLSLFACAASTTPPADAPAETEAAPVATETDPGPTAAEIQAEEEAEAQAAKLEAERAQMLGQAQVELRRWTPELRAEGKKLSETKYKDLKTGLTPILAGHHRVPGSAERDPARHPIETLEFFGLTPKMSVLEYGPGTGWYTELLAPLLATEGKLWVTTTDPNGAKENRQTFYAERLKLFLTKSPEVYGKVSPAVFDSADPKLNLSAPVDMALVIRGVHGWVNSDTVNTWLAQIHGSLKADGVLGIVQHRAAAGADPKESAKKGYVPEAWLIEQVEAQGFKLAAKSEINANAKDTKDYENGVWTLPPSLSLGETDRQKYIDIGESDRMTLKFTKVETK